MKRIIGSIQIVKKHESEVEAVSNEIAAHIENEDFYNDARVVFG